MARIHLVALAPEFVPAAQQLAAQLGLPYGGEGEFALQLGPQGLQLQEIAEQAAGAVRVDFVEGALAHRRLHGGGSGQMIAKAVGIQPGVRPVILDASGGGLLTGKCYYQWKNQQAIQLTNDLFDNDSFCMAGLRTRTLGIYEKDTGRSIVCDVAGFPYTLIWSALSKPLRFVCIEPWNSLPASVDDPQEWEQRAAAACLAPGEEWSTTLSTTFDR